jgi:hypothetical protein
MIAFETKHAHSLTEMSWDLTAIALAHSSRASR